jgi:hypothetical protein
MAFVWVQQWIALPVVVEEQMGDIPPGPGPQPLDITATGLARDEHQGTSNPNLSLKSSSSNTPFYSQLSAIPQAQLRPDLRSPTHPQGAHYPTQDHGPSPMNMGAMAGALPDYASANTAHGNPSMPQHDQRQLSGASTSALVYQLQQNMQVPGPASGSLPPHFGSGFNVSQFQQNFVPAQASQHHNYPQFPTGQQRVAAPGPMQGYQNFPQHSQYMYYPGPYGPPAQYAQNFSGQGSQNQTMYGRRQSTEILQQDGSFAGHRMAPNNMQGDAGGGGSMFTAPFVQAQGRFKK